jgi:hypothetical protein
VVSAPQLQHGAASNRPRRSAELTLPRRARSPVDGEGALEAGMGRRGGGGSTAATATQRGANKSTRRQCQRRNGGRESASAAEFFRWLFLHARLERSRASADAQYMMRTEQNIPRTKKITAHIYTAPAGELNFTAL